MLTLVQMITLGAPTKALEESLQGSWLRVGAGVGADIPAGTGLDDMRSLEPAEPGFDLLMIDTEAGLGRGFS